MFVFSTMKYHHTTHEKNTNKGLILKIQCDECSKQSDICLGFDMFDASQDFNDIQCPECNKHATILSCRFRECHYKWQGQTNNGRLLSDTCTASFNATHNSEDRYYRWKVLIISTEPITLFKETDLQVFIRHPWKLETCSVVVNKTNTIHDLFKIFLRQINEPPSTGGSLRFTIACKSYRPDKYSYVNLESLGIIEGSSIQSCYSCYHAEFTKDL